MGCWVANHGIGSGQHSCIKAYSIHLPYGIMPLPSRKRGRAVEGTSLENWRRGDPFVSSNLTASATSSMRTLSFLLYPPTYSPKKLRFGEVRRGCCSNTRLSISHLMCGNCWIVNVLVGPKAEQAERWSNFRLITDFLSVSHRNATACSLSSTNFWVIGLSSCHTY